MAFALSMGFSGLSQAVRSLFKRAQSIARRYNEPLLAIEDDFLTLGPELVPSTGNSATFNGTPSGTVVDVLPTATINNSSSHLLRFTVSNYTSGLFRVLVYGTGTVFIAYASGGSGNGNFEVLIQLAPGGSTNQAIRIQTWGVSPSTYTLTVNSLREILSADVFQDSAGTLPATVGSPIGLLTDRAFGGELGVELFNITSVSTAAGVTKVGSSLVLSGVTAVLAAQQFCVTAGKTYVVRGNVSNLTSGSVSLTLEGGVATTPTLSANGEFNAALTATVSGNLFVFSRSTPLSCTISNISVRELKGNHATQATAGNRPVLAQYNGHPSASFNGTTNSMQLATNPIGPNLSQPYTIIAGFVTGSTFSGPEARRIVSDFARSVGISTGGFLQHTHRGTADTFGPQLTINTAYVLEVTWSGAALSIRLNGQPSVSAALLAPTATPSAFFMGQLGTGIGFFNGQLTAVSVFDRVLTDSERTTIGKAFARELGLQKAYDYNLYVESGGASLDMDFTTDSYRIWEGV